MKVRTESIEKSDATKSDGAGEESVGTDNITEGYGCICGFKTADKTEFTSHVMQSARQDGKGTHKSIGRIDMATGKVIHPPWGERTDEEKKQTRGKAKGDGRSGDGEKAGKPQDKGPLLMQSQQIKVVPRIFTMDYTPIMRLAQDASIRFFKWRADMPFENFIDTCLYYFFKEHGVTLGAYSVHPSLLKEGQK
jgi:hypothetical protein